MVRGVDRDGTSGAWRRPFYEHYQMMCIARFWVTYQYNGWVCQVGIDLEDSGDRSRVVDTKEVVCVVHLNGVL